MLNRDLRLMHLHFIDGTTTIHLECLSQAIGQEDLASPEKAQQT